MIPATHNLPDVYRGDTMKEIRFELANNGSPINLSGASIRCDFKLKATATKVFRISTDDDKIVITDPEEGKFSIAKSVITWPAGIYNYDVEVTFADGTITTYVAGTMKVIQDVTG